jgi:phage terminase Nu1 subunit (DNA packaging protein)
MPLILNKREYADARGMSERTVTRWLAEGLPFEGSGKKGDPIRIDMAKATAWEISREVAKQLGDSRPAGGEQTSREEEELRKLRAERKLKEAEQRLRELELGEKEKNLIDIDLVEQTLASALTQMAMILRPVGRKVIPKVFTARNEAAGLQIFDDELTRAMSVAADMLEALDIHAAPSEEDSFAGG